MHHIHFHSEFLPDESFILELSGSATITCGDDAPSNTTHLVVGRVNEQHKQLPLLCGILIPYAGVPKETAEFCLSRPKVKLYSTHFNAAATAEMGVALLLAAARNVVNSDRAIRHGNWQQPRSGILLAGKTASILGYGEIGRRIGATLESLGMTVHGLRRGDPLNLESSNALIVAAPLTAETKGLIGADEILRLKTPRLIVNVGRGPIIQEQALYEACRSGAVAAAGIDVWYQYPKGDDRTFPSKFPIHELENVVLSPHTAGTGDDTEPQRSRSILDLLTKIIAGEPVREVTAELGY